MGHHHKNHKSKGKSLQTENAANTNTNSNMDVGAMLQNMNLNDIDLSKIDMNKVQSIMNKMNLPGKSQNGTTDTNGTSDGISNAFNDPRIFILNSLKEVLPSKKARKIARITKLLQMSNSMNSNR